MTATEPITINVVPEVARAFNSASPEERKQLELFVNLQLIAATRLLPPLGELLDEVGRKAQERGMTHDADGS